MNVKATLVEVEKYLMTEASKLLYLPVVTSQWDIQQANVNDFVGAGFKGLLTLENNSMSIYSPVPMKRAIAVTASIFEKEGKLTEVKRVVFFQDELMASQIVSFLNALGSAWLYLDNLAELVVITPQEYKPSKAMLE